MSARRNSARRRSGFTLVELMISLTIGLVVLGAAYYITRTTARVFAEQLRRAETQLTLRSAVETMRKDISRAGFAGVRSTNEMPGCNNSAATWVGAVGGNINDVSPVALAAVWVQTVAGRPPRLFLSGNFSTSEQYLINYDPAGAGTSIALQTTQHNFMRSFVTPFPSATPNTFLPNRFMDAFLANAALPGRMVKVMDLKQRRGFLRHVAGVNTANPLAPAVVLATPVPWPANASDTSACWSPQDGALVAPISTIVYEVVNTNADAEVAAAVSAGGTYMTGGDRFVLVRREVDMATLDTVLPPPAPPAVIRGTTRAVVDFVDPNGFAVSAVYDAAVQNTRSLPNLQRAPGPLAASMDPAVVPPEALRSLVIEIIAGSAEQQAGAQHEQARVAGGRRVARFEVSLPNLTRNPGSRP